MNRFIGLMLLTVFFIHSVESDFRVEKVNEVFLFGSNGEYPQATIASIHNDRLYALEERRDYMGNESYNLSMIKLPTTDSNVKNIFSFSYHVDNIPINQRIVASLFFSDEFACLPRRDDQYYKFDREGNNLGLFPGYAKLSESETGPKVITLQGKEYPLPSLAFLGKQYKDFLYLTDFVVLKCSQSVIIIDKKNLDIETVSAPYLEVPVQDINQVFSLFNNHIYFNNSFYKVHENLEIEEEIVYPDFNQKYIWAYAKEDFCYRFDFLWPSSYSWNYYLFQYKITEVDPSTVPPLKWELYQ